MSAKRGLLREFWIIFSYEAPDGAEKWQMETISRRKKQNLGENVVSVTYLIRVTNKFQKKKRTVCIYHMTNITDVTNLSDF